MRKMCKVERFKCAWCGKEFRTPDKHDCNAYGEYINKRCPVCKGKWWQEDVK